MYLAGNGMRLAVFYVLTMEKDQTVKQCEHCGQCCLSGIPCMFGQILFDITDHNPAPCPACKKENGLYWCGLITNPIDWFKPLVGNFKWKCEAMADIAGIYIGIGDGCCTNPSKKKIIQKLKTAFSGINGT